MSLKKGLILLVILLFLVGCAKKDNSNINLQIGWTKDNQAEVNVENDNNDNNSTQIELNHTKITTYADNEHRSPFYWLYLEARDENGELIDIDPDEVSWFCEENPESIQRRLDNQIIYSPKIPGYHTIVAVYENSTASLNALVYNFFTLIYSSQDTEKIGYDFENEELTHVTENRDIYIKDNYVICPYGVETFPATSFSSYTLTGGEEFSNTNIYYWSTAGQFYLVKTRNNKVYKVSTRGMDMIHIGDKAHKYHFVYDYAGELEPELEPTE